MWIENNLEDLDFLLGRDSPPITYSLRLANYWPVKNCQ